MKTASAKKGMKMPFDGKTMVRWALQIAAGMAHIHGRGFIHRDVKPHNVLLNKSNEALVADLGTVRRPPSGLYPNDKVVPATMTATAKEHNIAAFCDEVDQEQALQIAKQLKALIKDGTVSKVIQEVEKEEEEAEKNNKFVDICHEMLAKKVERETGKTNLAPADYPEKDHDTWSWIQSKYDYGSSYPFTMENVERFIKFCEDSRGFRIC